MDFKNRLTLIHNLISQNKLTEALIKCENLAKKFPDSSYLLNLQGLILQNSGQIRKSIKYFQKAIFLQKDNYAAKNNLANSYKNLYEFSEAETLYEEIIREDLKNIKALNNYANLKKEINQYQEAKKLLLKALELESNNINILLNLAMCCQGIGEPNEAKNYVLKVIDLDPNNTSAYKLLSTIIDYNKDQKYLKKMKQLTDEEIFKNYSSSQKVELLFGLSKAYEDIKDFENSFKFLKQANFIENENNIQKTENIKKLFDSLIKLFKSIEIKKSEITNKKKYIFICGMPRSGTTLVEQIVASHSSVSGAGEVHYLSEVINKNFLNNQKFDTPKILDEMAKSKNSIYEQYNNLIKFHNFNSDIITDKAPQNFIWIGFIKIFFPGSKIIYCSRNPKDNCLSIFKNYFSSRTMYWAYDQRNIAEYYILYSNLMNFWKSKFKDDIHEANYEKIVNSPEQEVKKMISFCDLDWEPDCLNFYKNKKTPVQTVSVSQANRPIYKTSVNSNELYVKYLSEMFNILDTNL